ncbi:hypothetical protein GCM10009533_62470 [Saccharopolyspora spinosporotrichia]|uniref:Uncharacterized protein n=1 Tax=Saccharopolyspora erythraea TaxID=1836 RepID=A0ABN1E0H1_SACER
MCNPPVTPMVSSGALLTRENGDGQCGAVSWALLAPRETGSGWPSGGYPPHPAEGACVNGIRRTAPPLAHGVRISRRGRPGVGRTLWRALRLELRAMTFGGRVRV